MLQSASSLLRLTSSFVRLSPRLCPSSGSGITPLQDRVLIRFMSTSPSFVGPADVTREKVGDAADRQLQNRIHLLTPEDRWRERSKKALESAGRTPPAHTYSGTFSCTVFITFICQPPSKRSDYSCQSRRRPCNCVQTARWHSSTQ